MTVQWEPYLWEEPRSVSPQEFEILERQWGVTLPVEYKRLMSQHQGMSPKPGSFKLGEGNDALSVLLTITVDPEKKPYAVMRVHDVLKPHIPPGVFPFAKTPGGEFLCFDYKETPDQPKVVHVSVELLITPIADSFSAFLETLHDE
ncbi:MAG TPA: SMI1/KNR4 family protein [Archangium sp.]|nr:SMI1/KNR4 family protein [Archangium sp.]